MVNLRNLVILSLAVVGLLPAPAGSQALPAKPLLQSLQWRALGPFRGGRVLAVSGVPGQPSHFYFGAVNGGVWETQDAGRTWAAIFDEAGVGSIGAIAVAPSEPKVVYVGTGEPDMRSNIAQGEGMFKSVDAGHTWRRIGLEDSRQIGRIVIDPRNPAVVVVAALGHPYGPNSTRGVFRSSDGGATWQRTLHTDDNTGAIDLAAEPGAPDVLYASLWQTRRPPWNVYPPASGPGGGIYKSVDGGVSWVALAANGLPDQPGRIGLAVAPAVPARVYALVDAKDGGLYRSDDRGASWTRVSDDARLWGRGWYFGGVTVDPRNPDVVYVCNTAMYRSDDGGHTFKPVKGAPGGDDYHQLWIDPAEPAHRALAVDQGAVISLNGGDTWSSWFNQPTGQFYHVVTDNRFPYWVYGSQQDSGAAGIPSRTTNVDGINLTSFRELSAGGESDEIAPDPEDPQLIYGGRVDRLDLRTWQTQALDPTLAYPDIYRGTWTLPLVFGKSAAHPLYFANQRIFRTTDHGVHWDRISPDLTRENPKQPANLDANTSEDHEAPGSRRGVVYSIGPSPLDDNLLWAGTDDGLVWKSIDAGKHWTNVTPSTLTAWSKVGVVEPSHFDRNTAYIAVDRHRLDDPAPYVYSTHDGGKTWNLIVAGIADGGIVNSVNAVREDPARSGLLYCGTERGVYVSIDDGAHWQSLQQNLPRTSVRDLEVHDADLVIATHGRGFWVIDDIAPVRALAVDSSLTTRLIAPTTAFRVRPTGFLGSPMPLDEPHAANPPLGAYIDYVLGAAVEGPVTLTIRDASGAVVRTYTSATNARPPDMAKRHTAPEWTAAVQPVATGVGAHRFVWDLHFAPASSLTHDDNDDPEETEEGLWAPPGRYEVELGVAGRAYRQPLTVLPDPRVSLDATAYARQLALGKEIERARVELAHALEETGQVHKAIGKQTVPKGTELARKLRDTDARIVALADLAPPNRSPDSTGMPPQTTSGLRYLQQAFRKLARAVDGADAMPTADVEQGYVQHRQLLDATLAGWVKLKGTEVAALDSQLKALHGAGLMP